MNVPFAIFIGAGVGGIARYGVGRLIPRAHTGDWPLSTLLINLGGCLLIGFLLPWLGRLSAPEWVRAGVLVGVLGGFTTFSAFGRETFDLIAAGRTPAAVAYVLASNAVGLLLVWAGHAAANLVAPIPAAGS
ncbi:MAG TPA: fluoride efflux transporter CrcB [Tepidisphaeraceae bacterium]|jgi:CrcB protein